MKDFGNKEAMSKNLRYFMSQKEVTPKRLSRDIDIPYTTVLSWLKGDNYPRIDKIDLLAEYFGIMKSDLIEDNDRHIISKESAVKNINIAKMVKKMQEDNDFYTMVNKLSQLSDAQRASIEQLLNAFFPDK